jgi:DNA-binding MarR family transcriptional regulator
MNMENRSKIDWESIETADCAGVIPLRQIAAMHGVTHGAINKRAKREGWIRDLAGKVDKRAKTILLSAIARAGIQTGIQKTVSKDLDTIAAEIRAEKRAVSEKKIVESAATLSAAVQIAHRGELAELRRQARELLEKLDEAEKNGATLKERIQMLCQLVGAYAQVIRLEREAYGIDKGDVMKDEKDRAIRVEIVSPQAAVRVVAE